MLDNNLDNAIVDQLRARADRFNRYAANPGASVIGGPQSDPAWDAFWGALDRKQKAAGDLGLTYNFRPQGLRQAPMATSTGPDMSHVSDVYDQQHPDGAVNGLIDAFNQRTPRNGSYPV